MFDFWDYKDNGKRWEFHDEGYAKCLIHAPELD